MSQNAASGTSRVKATDLLNKYLDKVHKVDDKITKNELYLKKLLAARSAHLPGNNWCQDWIQWMVNNHPILALCFRHRLNPVGFWPRVVILISSVSFGLTVTNLIYLFYRTHPDANGTILKMQLGDNTAMNIDTLEITYEAVILWTFGGFIHSLLDLGMWHLNACACCLQSSCAKAGPYISIAVAAMLTASSTFAILWRADYENDIKGNTNATAYQDEEKLFTDQIEHGYNFSSFQFLWNYYVELLSVWVLHFPIVGTVFFSGALYGVGWGCIGGRPKEIRRQQQEELRKMNHANNDPFSDDIL
jgi:hypothetical protein